MAGLLAGCSASSAGGRPAPSTSGPTTTSAQNPPPAGLPAFYATPQRLPGGPGTVIRDEVVAAPGVDGTVYRVMYVSRSEAGADIPVTGLVAVPRPAPPAGGYPVVSWAHGTTGLAPSCAPSANPVTDVAFLNRVLDAGMEAVASDYQGLGTAGPLPYLVGTVAARNTIDMVRAARRMPAAHASARYAVWGHSEGGQAALFALKIARSYAPELHLVGVVAGAAPSQFGELDAYLAQSPFRFYLLMVAVGYHAAYGDRAPLDQVLTPLGLSFVPAVTTSCWGAMAAARYPAAQLVKADPYTIPGWRSLLDANDAGRFSAAAPVPLLLPQGGADEQIPVSTTEALARHLCGLGQSLSRWIYPGQSHAGVVSAYLPDMLTWLQHRFAGRPGPDRMTPTGEPGVQVTSCP